MLPTIRNIVPCLHCANTFQIPSPSFLTCNFLIQTRWSDAFSCVVCSGNHCGGSEWIWPLCFWNRKVEIIFLLWLRGWRWHLCGQMGRPAHLFNDPLSPLLFHRWAWRSSEENFYQMDKRTVLQGNVGDASSPSIIRPTAPLLLMVFFISNIFCSPVGQDAHQRYVQRSEGRKAASGPAGGSN